MADVNAKIGDARSQVTGAPTSGRGLRFGLLAGVLFQLGSLVWDRVLAPEYVHRLVYVRLFGVLAMAGVAAMSASWPHRRRELTAAAALLMALTVSAATAVLPYGAAYGVGGMVMIAAVLGLVAKDGRTALLAAACALAAAAITLASYRVAGDIVVALAYFSLPAFAVAVINGHTNGVRREREVGVRDRLSALQEDLERFGYNDALTGVHGAKQLSGFGRREIALARRRKGPLSAIKIDIDSLASINSTYGRQSGDETLRAVASMCQATLRETDLLARMDGDKFAAVLPDVDAEGAFIISERLKRTLAKASVLAGQQVLQVSVNVASATLIESDRSIDDLLKRASEAMAAARLAQQQREAAS